MIRRITSLLGSGIPDHLRRAYEAKVNAKGDAEKLVAETQIPALEIAQASRQASADNWDVRWGIGIVARALSVLLALVAIVSAFPQLGWIVHALPAPMNDWLGRIILSLFGLSAVKAIFRR